MAHKFRESNENGVSIAFTCDACPVQAEGDVDGDKFYFRARWDSWTFSIPSNPADDAVEVSIGAAEGYHYKQDYGVKESWSAGWMELDEAEAFIRQAADEYRAWKQRARG